MQCFTKTQDVKITKFWCSTYKRGVCNSGNLSTLAGGSKFLLKVAAGCCSTWNKCTRVFLPSELIHIQVPSSYIPATPWQPMWIPPFSTQSWMIKRKIPPIGTDRRQSIISQSLERKHSYASIHSSKHPSTQASQGCLNPGPSILPLGIRRGARARQLDGHGSLRAVLGMQLVIEPHRFPCDQTHEYAPFATFLFTFIPSLTYSFLTH